MFLLEFGNWELGIDGLGFRVAEFVGPQRALDPQYLASQLFGL